MLPDLHQSLCVFFLDITNVLTSHEARFEIERYFLFFKGMIYKDIFTVGIKMPFNQMPHQFYCFTRWSRQMVKWSFLVEWRIQPKQIHFYMSIPQMNQIMLQIEHIY